MELKSLLLPALVVGSVVGVYWAGAACFGAHRGALSQFKELLFGPEDHQGSQLILERLGHLRREKEQALAEGDGEMVALIDAEMKRQLALLHEANKRPVPANFGQERFGR